MIMPAHNKHSQAVKIRWEIPAPFPMDLLVRTAQEVTRGLAEGDTFLTELFSKGKVLYQGGAPLKADKACLPRGFHLRRGYNPAAVPLLVPRTLAYGKCDQQRR